MNNSNIINGRQRMTFRQILRRLKKEWQIYLLILPGFINLFIFSYMPMYGVQIAFRNFSPRKGIWGSTWVGLDYFQKFIKHPNFMLFMKNTLRIGLYSLATFPCAIIFALLLNEISAYPRLKKFIQMISYIPHFLSTVVVCALIILIFGLKSGLVNNVIEMLGGTRIDFMTVPQYFEDIYVWSGEWQGLGWGAIIYLAALSNVSPELVEAARIDGASRLQIIRHVNLPAIMPTITIMLIFACGGIVSVGSEKILLLQNALNLSRSQVISTYVYELGILGGQFSYSTAIGLFNNIINVIFLVITNKIAKKVSDVGIW